MDTIKAQQIYEEMNICVIQHDSKINFWRN